MASSAVAEEEGGVSEGLDMMNEGLSRLLEGLAAELGPLMDETLAEIAPLIENLMEAIDDLTAYEAPEVLPNGDIIIRRKPDAPPRKDLPEITEVET